VAKENVRIPGKGLGLVAAKYNALARDKRMYGPRPRFSLTAKTLHELERLYLARWGNHLPDDDAGRDDLELALNYVAGVDAKIAWAAHWAPWLPHEDAVSLASTPSRWLRARPLGERLGLTDAERTALAIEKIRPIDVTDEALNERHKQKDRERQARKRRLQRAGKPAPLSETKPWVAEGISRRTWERRRAEAPTQRDDAKRVHDNTSSLIADGICVTMPPAIAVGTPQKTIRLKGVDGAAIVGNPSRRFKTRFPTAMRLTKETAAYPLAVGFDREKILWMFEMFRNHNIAQRTYSPDWNQAWMNWVDREVDIVNDWYDRARRRALFRAIRLGIASSAIFTHLESSWRKRSWDTPSSLLTRFVSETKKSSPTQTSTPTSRKPLSGSGSA
jgi:hypothetical protein